MYLWIGKGVVGGSEGGWGAREYHTAGEHVTARAFAAQQLFLQRQRDGQARPGRE